MTTATVETDSGDGMVFGEDDFNSYATAHATSTGYDATSTSVPAGQSDDGGGIIICNRILLPFTLALGAGAVITAATISLTKELFPGNVNTDFKIVRVSGAALPISSNTETDYDAILAGVDEGVIGNPSTWSDGVTKTLAIVAASVNANGTNFYGLLTSTDLAGTAPAAGKDETIMVHMKEAASSANRPALEVTYTLAGLKGARVARISAGETIRSIRGG